MTPVKLTESERLAVRNSSAVKDAYIAKIMDAFAYFLATPAEPIAVNDFVTRAKSRHWAAEVKANPALLLNDSNLMMGLEFNLLARDYDFKDTDTVGSLDDQVLSYLNDNNHFAFLVDDYFASKGNLFLM